MASTGTSPLRNAIYYALRAAFRLTPMPLATRDRLRQRFLDTHADLVPAGPRGRVTAAGNANRRVRADERALGYVEYRQERLPEPLPATLVAFYLPQFHAIPENDAWWGKGFTEWRNVTRALPQFEGHLQPRLPGDLGFYDLRNPEVMREQSRLAREYGIGAFCFYFYWFGGKTLLETPLRNWLSDRSIDFPFCLCWANEKWSRTWDGRGNEILIDQAHSPEDDLAFIAYIADYLRDPRYLRIDGKPLLLVYRPGLFPDLAATASRWRRWCRDNGLGEIHLAYVQSFERPTPASIGFDAAVEFPPNLSRAIPLAPPPAFLNETYAGEVLDWPAMASQFKDASIDGAYPLYRGVNPAWDNEARRPGRGRSFVRSSPAAYQQWLIKAMASGKATPSTAGPVFINAWNEWAEGAYLEPDVRHGYGWLQATRNALKSAAGVSSPKGDARKVCVIHAYYPDVLVEMLDGWGDTSGWHFVITAGTAQASAIRAILDERTVSAEVHILENRGRDVLPFLRMVQQLADAGIDVVLKLHTKRSLHRENGDAWRREIVASLASPSSADAVTAAFSADPKLGMVGPAGHLLSMRDYIGGNRAQVDQLAAYMGIATIPDDTVFVAGSMFWVRLASLLPLLSVPLAVSDFEEEKGQIDGTLAHAVERMFAVSALSSGHHVKSTAAVLGLAEPADKPYPFAATRQGN